MDIFNKIFDAKNKGIPLVLATVINVKGSAPREIGAKMIIWRDGRVDGSIGGGAIEKAVIEETEDLFSSGQAKIFEYKLTDLKMQCGGNMTLFLEPVIPKPQLVIFGAGHIGLALAKIADMLNFSQTIVDDRPEFAARDRFPTAQSVVCAPYSDAFSEISFTDDTFIVIVTYKHLHDQEILEYCVGQPSRYLGMIGSTTKVAKAFKLLKEKGISSEMINRIHSPIGLDIGANTPEEIAIAIAAEIIAVRNGAGDHSQSMKASHD